MATPIRFVNRLFYCRAFSAPLPGIQTFKVFCSNEATQRKICIGDSAEMTRVFTDEDVKTFASLVCDNNPIHTDGEQYAKSSRFRGPVVHGILVTGLFSSLIGTKMPGHGTILVSQNLQFKAPVYIGEQVTAHVEVEDIKKQFLIIKANCFATSTKKVVLRGTFVVTVDKDNVVR